MRLKTGIWVAAYLRRCNVEGIFAAVRRRGAEEAGAVFVKVNRLDGTGALYGPAPQSAFDEAQPADRLFVVLIGRDTPATEPDIDRKSTRLNSSHSSISYAVFCLKKKKKKKKI